MQDNANDTTAKKPMILAIDDEAMNLRVLEAILEPLGYDVISFKNSEEGIKAAIEHSPDLILLDVMMPVMNGFEAAEILKNHEKTKIIPIVMVTALQDVRDRVRALEAGADDFLSKPVDKTELRARVQSLLKVKKYNDHMINYQKNLEIEVGKRTEQLNHALEMVKLGSLDTIYRLSRAAVYKDEGTGAHIQRMAHYAAAIARKLGLDEVSVETILYATPMHDIGKIGIPDHILLKPGKLTPEEWDVMKQHTTIGSKILEGSDAGFIKMGEIIAHTHHERWDGNGYPRGLAGEAIPLVGRIAMVADVFDALISKRPYKDKFDLEKSYNIIKNDSGSFFDPQIVEAFLSIKDEVSMLMEEYEDDQAEFVLPEIDFQKCV